MAAAGVSAPAAPTSDGEEAIQVIVRVRPMSQTDVINNGALTAEDIGLDPNQPAVEVHSDNTLSCHREVGVQQFTFDRTFGPESTQEEIYESCARKVVEDILEGYNGTIFAYGMTGAGKTHTMEGSSEQPGIIPRAFQQIFEQVETGKEEHRRYLVRCTYCELYNEAVRDLLVDGGQSLNRSLVKGGASALESSLQSIVVESAAEIQELLVQGKARRATRATKMNHASSRSHSVFTVVVECAEKRGPDGQDPAASDQEHIHVGKLNLVDLAGSERNSATGTSGAGLKEASMINSSLTVLGRVIAGLSSGSVHIPYRESKLTQMLKDSLGGNTRTNMIANLSPAVKCIDETLATLRFAVRVKKVKNKPKINEDPKDAMMRQYVSEIEKLKMELELARSPNKAMQNAELSAEILEESEREKQALLQQAAVEREHLEEDRMRLQAQLADERDAMSQQRQEQEQLQARLRELETQLLTSSAAAVAAAADVLKASDDPRLDTDGLPTLRDMSEQDVQRLLEIVGMADLQSKLSALDGIALAETDVAELVELGVPRALAKKLLRILEKRYPSSISNTNRRHETANLADQSEPGSPRRIAVFNAEAASSPVRQPMTRQGDVPKAVSPGPRWRRTQAPVPPAADPEDIAGEDEQELLPRHSRSLPPMLSRKRRSKRGPEMKSTSPIRSDITSCLDLRTRLCSQGAAKQWSSSIPLKQWNGIATDGNDSTRVQGLDLSFSELNCELSDLSGPLGRLPKLTSLSLGNNSGLEGRLLGVGALTGLQSLMLESTSVCGDLSELSRLVELRTLKLRSTSVTGVLAGLAPLSKLRVLLLQHTKIEGDLVHVWNLTKLQQLMIDGTRVTGTLRILHDMTNLRVLSLTSTSVAVSAQQIDEFKRETGCTTVIVDSEMEPPPEYSIEPEHAPLTPAKETTAASEAIGASQPSPERKSLAAPPKYDDVQSTVAKQPEQLQATDAEEPRSPLPPLAESFGSPSLERIAEDTAEADTVVRALGMPAGNGQPDEVTPEELDQIMKVMVSSATELTPKSDACGDIIERAHLEPSSHDSSSVETLPQKDEVDEIFSRLRKGLPFGGVTVRLMEFAGVISGDQLLEYLEMVEQLPHRSALSCATNLVCPGMLRRVNIHAYLVDPTEEARLEAPLAAFSNSTMEEVADDAAPPPLARAFSWFSPPKEAPRADNVTDKPIVGGPGIPPSRRGSFSGFPGLAKALGPISSTSPEVTEAERADAKAVAGALAQFQPGPFALYRYDQNLSEVTIDFDVNYCTDPMTTVAVVGWEDRETRTDGAPPYTVYLILVTTSVCAWQVTRRYSDFEKLHSSMSELEPKIPFPNKGIFRWRNEAFKENRRKHLEEYLDHTLERVLKLTDRSKNRASLRALVSFLDPEMGRDDNVGSAYLHQSVNAQDSLDANVHCGTHDGLNRVNRSSFDNEIKEDRLVCSLLRRVLVFESDEDPTQAWLDHKALSEWPGIEADWTASMDMGRVVKLDMRGWGLVTHLGRLARLLRCFSDFRSLDLGANPKMMGNLEDISDMAQLECVDLSSTLVAGTLRGVTELNFLVELSLGNTRVSGSLSDLRKCVHLRKLCLRKINVQGTLTDLGKMQSLSHVNLSLTPVMGNVSALCKLSALQEVYLNKSLVTGNLDSLCSLSMLRALALSCNDISGNIGCMGRLANLRFLNLGVTNVQGELSSLLALSKLRCLYLDNTHVQASPGDRERLMEAGCTDIVLPKDETPPAS